LSLLRKTIPYAAVDGSRERPFTSELELASLYILADARRGPDTLSATSFVYYPFQVRCWNGALVIVDMLGLNIMKFRYNQVPDVDGFQKRLDAVVEYPQAFLKILKDGRETYKSFPEWETLAIRGLVSKPGKPKEVEALLQSAEEFKEYDGSKVFQPTLKPRDVRTIFSQLDSIGKDIDRDVRTLSKAKAGLGKALNVVMKVLDEEVENVRDSSAKAVAKLETLVNRKRARLESALKKDLDKMKASFGKKVGPLREKRTKRRRRFTRMQNRLERLRREGNSKDIREYKETLAELMSKLREMEDAIKELEADHRVEVKEVKDDVASELHDKEKAIEEEKSRVKKEVQVWLDLRAKIEREANVVSRMMDSLIKKKRGRTESLLRVQVNLDAEEAEIHVPFYVFRFGESRFDFHPPVVVGAAQGLFNRLRRMLAENLEGKMNTLIRPRGLFLDRHLERAVKSLGRKGEISDAYRGREEGLNVFRSRGAMDRIMAGLVEMRREGWIGDGEYIRLQVGLVERLGEVTQP
jgi:hypothetical protein